MFPSHPPISFSHNFMLTFSLSKETDENIKTYNIKLQKS